MKKMTISLLAVIFSLGAAFSQPVSDFGIIPVGVTLNSILRLNITSGGNIEYVVNTLDQYTVGFPADDTNPDYQTRFTVASSVNWEMTIYADNADFIGVDEGAGTNTFPCGHLAYYVEYLGILAIPTSTITTEWGVAGAPAQITAAPVIFIDNNTGNAGDVVDNDFQVLWEMGTANTAGVLLGFAADRYVLNVLLDLAQD